MLDQEAEMEKLESEFPALASVAFAAGLSVMEADGDIIYEVFPDGHRVAVKEMEPSTRDICGRRITIR